MSKPVLQINRKALLLLLRSNARCPSFGTEIVNKISPESRIIFNKRPIQNIAKRAGDRCAAGQLITISEPLWPTVVSEWISGNLISTADDNASLCSSRNALDFYLMFSKETGTHPPQNINEFHVITSVLMSCHQQAHRLTWHHFLDLAASRFTVWWILDKKNEPTSSFQWTRYL